MNITITDVQNAKEDDALGKVRDAIVLVEMQTGRGFNFPDDIKLKIIDSIPVIHAHQASLRDLTFTVQAVANAIWFRK